MQNNNIKLFGGLKPLNLDEIDNLRNLNYKNTIRAQQLREVNTIKTILSGPSGQRSSTAGS